MEWQLVLCVPPVYAELMTMRKHWFDEGWLLAACRNGCAAGCCPEDAGANPLRRAEDEYEEDMRLPSAGGTGDGGHCCRCAVLGALFFCALCCLLCGLD